ncbi:MAG: 4Fe-4S binding protein [bacterium]
MSYFHKITSENHPFQRKTLYALAKFIELPLLSLSYKLLRGGLKPLGDRRLFRKLMTEAIAKPFALYGDTSRPVPYGKLLKHIGEIEGAIAVGPCRCRIVHHACGHPLDTDIVIRTGTDAWLRAFPREYRVIEKDEAKKIVTECHRLGMFHMVFYHCPATGCAEYVICNCCTCGCVPYILNRDLGQENFPIFRGEWEAATMRERCKGCSECVRVCPFNARAVIDGKGVTWDCFGCGLCAYACPEKAIEMVPDERRHHDHPGIQNLTSR